MPILRIPQQPAMAAYLHPRLSEQADKGKWYKPFNIDSSRAGQTGTVST
jgi:hypothetical protein